MAELDDEALLDSLAELFEKRFAEMFDYEENDDEEETISCDDEAEESRDEEERQNETGDKNEADDMDKAKIRRESRSRFRM